VILELGADVGALVLFTPAEMDGREIEISRDDDPAVRRTHSQVRPRHMVRVTRYAAVYPDLSAGVYTVWAADQTSRAGRVVITGGRVTNWSWPNP